MSHVWDKYLVPVESLNTVYIGGGSLLQKPIEDKITSFGNLRHGWDYGDGGPIPKRTRDLAIQWNRFLQTQFGETDAFPGGSGEIVIATGNDTHYLELIVEPDDSVSLAYDFQGKQAFYRPNMPAIEAVQVLIELAGQICGVLGYYTPTNTIRNEGNLRAQRSATQRMMAAYPSSEWNVFVSEEDQFVITSKNFTRESQASWETPQFFGSLNPIFYRAHTR
jgi:hypothetical protein